MSFESCLQACRNYSYFQSLNKGGKTRNFSKPQNLFREELGIFPSSRGCIEGQNLWGGKPRNISKSQNFYREGRLRIFPSSEAYMEEESSEFSKSQSHRGGDLEIFFLNIFHVSLHISSYFPHISSDLLKSHRRVRAGDNTQILDSLPPPLLAEIF